MEAASVAPAPPARPAPSPRALRTQAFRVAIELCRARLAASRSGRFARIAAAVIVGGGLVVALSLRATDGAAAPVGGMLRKAGGALAWLSGGVLALAAARDTAAADRSEGLEALAAARGVSAQLLAAARTAGAAWQIARGIGLPLAALALVTAALAADVTSALRRVLAAALLLAWGAVAGITLGALSAACGRAFRARGPTVLVALVVGERLVAGALGLAAWSVPGALDAALVMALGAAGVGGGR